MNQPSTARQLAGAEMWVGSAAEGQEPVFVAGWEDGSPFCATVCATDVGLAFCRRCPAHLVRRVLGTGRAASGSCPADVALLAFPAPRGSRGQVAVLRVGPPSPAAAAAVADTVRVAASTLRRAARAADRIDGRASLAAARVLRDPTGLLDWQVEQRTRGSDRRRTATAALAQMIATSAEFHELYRASRRQRAELERNQRRLDRLARETLRAKDIERARIAHQIHDTAAQSMVSAFRFLEAAKASVADGSAFEGHLASAGERLVTAIGEVRAVLNSLLPPGLEELGLAQALRVRVADLTAGSGIEAAIVGDLPRLEGYVEQALYGIAAEALSNAVRHSGARTIRVDLGQRRGRAVLSIRDDGAGFDPAVVVQRSESGGLGLLGISRQASWLGGQATVRSGQGGTQVRVSVPLAGHRRGSSSGAIEPIRATPTRQAGAAPRPSRSTRSTAGSARSAVRAGRLQRP